jgi:RNA polymerase sigma-70 factor, ECF subfamily
MFTNFYSIDTKEIPFDKGQQLVERIAARDESALSELYDLYSKIIYSLIIKIVKSREEAEDLLQSVFIKVWNKASTFNKNRGSVYSWLIALARNNAIDRTRSKEFKNININAVEIEALDSFLRGTETASIDEAIIHERSEIINKALMQIPEEQYKIIELAYFEGMTQSEIAKKLSVPIGTIKSRTRQALIKLEKIIGPLILYSN